MGPARRSPDVEALEVLEVPARLDAAGLERLGAALDASRGERRAPLVLRGRGEDFCGGMSFEAPPASEEAARAALERFAHLLLALRALPRPTLAVVRGAALGGGLALACAADLVLAAPDARLGLPEALFGLLPAVALPFVAERAGARAAERLALTAEPLGAQEAARLGLVDAVHPEAELEAAVRRCARALRRVEPEARAALKGEASDRLREAALAGAVPSALRMVQPEVRARIERFERAGVPPWR